MLKNKDKDTTLITLSENSIHDDALMKIYNKRINPYQVFSHSIDDFKVSSTIKINVILKDLDSIKHKQIIIHPDSDTKGEIEPKTTKSKLFGDNSNVHYNIIKPKSYTNEWIISYFSYVSKLLNRNVISYAGMMKRIKNSAIQSYNNEGEERDDLISMLKKNIYFYNRTITDLDDILNIMSHEDYKIGLYEIEVICDYLDINCIVIGKNNATYMNNIFSIKSNSNIFMMFNYIRASDNKNDEFRPIIKYKDNLQQYLYRDIEIPSKILAIVL